jgi:hypothetical protein
MLVHRKLVLQNYANPFGGQCRSPDHLSLGCITSQSCNSGIELLAQNLWGDTQSISKPSHSLSPQMWVEPLLCPGCGPKDG